MEVPLSPNLAIRYVYPNNFNATRFLKIIKDLAENIEQNTLSERVYNSIFAGFRKILEVFAAKSPYYVTNKIKGFRLLFMY